MIVTEESLFPNTFGMELIYSFIIIFCSLLIYASTKKMYNISKYPGIKYFRESFLFFAIAYFFKSFLSFLLFIFDFHEVIEFSNVFLGVITIFFFMYASTMAIFYLVYSVAWKNFRESRYTVPLIHVFALVISAVSIMIREAGILILLQVLLFLFVAGRNFSSYRKLGKNKRAGSIYIIYLFLFIFWMLNLADSLVSGFGAIFELVVSMVSIGLFLLILYKVTRIVGT